MKVMRAKEEKNLEKRYEIKKDYYYIYVLNGLNRLKKYIREEEYNNITKMHNDEFLEFLISIASHDDSILVKPEDFYAYHDYCVSSYLYKDHSGTTIDTMYPKTNLVKLIEALDRFYNKLDSLGDLDLSKLRSSDIAYNGEILIANIDRITYGNGSNNKNILDDLLFRGIFGIKDNQDIVINSEYMQFNYNNMNNMVDFLNIYREYINSQFGKCDYVKNLSKGIINGRDKGSR